MYPIDAITINHELVGASSFTMLATSTNTILGISIQQSGNASITQLKCGSTVLALNYGKDFSFNAISYLCYDKNITVSKTGNDNSSIIITYVPYNIASSTSTATATSSIISSIPDSLGLEESLLIACIIIVMLGVRFWGGLFGYSK